MIAKRKIILIVDDNVVNRMMLKRILLEQYDLFEAGNGKEALELLTAHPGAVSAVLLDLVMPEMDGCEFLRIARATPSLAELPVIALTGAESESLEVQALEAGANDFLEKPFRPDVIRKRLSNTMLLQQALLDAQTDSLTGLLNRTAFTKYAERYFHSNLETGRRAALLMIDIDNFKQANDTMGHAYGDAVLIMFGEIVRAVGGENALVGRLGGDEFIVLLCDIPDDHFVQSVASDILYRLETTSRKDTAATCSIGISLFPDHATERRTLYFCADEAMYSAKQLGKNQYAVYGSATDFSQRNSWMNKEWLLDELDSCIYICDHETHEVYYLNAKAAALVKNAPPEAPRCLCYLAGLADQPFQFCSQLPLSGTVHCTAMTKSRTSGQNLLYKGKLINWNGRIARMAAISPVPENSKTE